MTVLERLDMREFHKGHVSNGRLSMFARGRLQKKLMETLNWHGYDFVEIEPDYTSQTCPVCSFQNKTNRNGKNFVCGCCGFHADADYVGSLNIKNRTTDEEILELCEKYKYKHEIMQKELRSLYQKRNEDYIRIHPIPRLNAEA